MKTTIISLLGLLVLVMLGCATAPHRARQYSEIFASLPKETQKRILHGYIREGDSQEAVYIAWGSPQIREKVHYTLNETEDHWVYIGQAAEGSKVLGPGNFRFVTVNDMSWDNPFGQTRHRDVRVVFREDQFVRLEQELSDGTTKTETSHVFLLPQDD